MYGISRDLTPIREDTIAADNPALSVLLRLPYKHTIQACEEQIRSDLLKVQEEKSGYLLKRIKRTFDLWMHLIVDDAMAEVHREGPSIAQLASERWKSQRQFANRLQFEAALRILSNLPWETQLQELVSEALLSAWVDTDDRQESRAMMATIVKELQRFSSEVREKALLSLLEPRFSVSSEKAFDAFSLLCKKDFVGRDELCATLAGAWMRNRHVSDMAKIMGIATEILPEGDPF